MSGIVSDDDDFEGKDDSSDYTPLASVRMTVGKADIEAAMRMGKSRPLLEALARRIDPWVWKRSEEQRAWRARQEGGEEQAEIEVKMAFGPRLDASKELALILMDALEDLPDALVGAGARGLVADQFGEEGLCVFEPVPEDFPNAERENFAFEQRAVQARASARAVLKAVAAAIREERQMPEITTREGAR